MISNHQYFKLSNSKTSTLF